VRPSVPFRQARHRLKADGYDRPNPRRGFSPNTRRRFPTDAEIVQDNSLPLHFCLTPHLASFRQARHRLKADGYDRPNPRSGFSPNTRRRFPTDAEIVQDSPLPLLKGASRKGQGVRPSVPFRQVRHRLKADGYNRPNPRSGFSPNTRCRNCARQFVAIIFPCAILFLALHDSVSENAEEF